MKEMDLPDNDPTPSLASLEQDIPNSPRSNHKVVIALHGIRTRGKWQKQLAPLLAKRGFIPELLDYGWFSAISILIPAVRMKKIEWFRKEFERIRVRYPTVRPSLIAHSFGSYLVCRALQKYAGLLTFDRVILCGSIVRRDYDWPLVCKNQWIKRVLNDCGRLDIWAGNVQKFVGDAGPSGRLGFEHQAPCVSECFHPEWGHSDFFFELNFEERWIPFLEGKEVASVEFPSRTHVPKALLWTMTAIVLLSISTFAYFAGWFNPGPPAKTIFTGVRIAGIYLTEGGGEILNLPVSSKVPTAPKSISTFFARFSMQYQANIGNVGVPISVLPKEFYEPSPENQEIHVAVHDFEDDGNPEFIYALFDPDALFVQGCVVKCYPSANEADAARRENFVLAGEFAGQQYIMVSKERLFCPIGTQIGPSDGNVYKFYNSKLREWSEEENRFIEENDSVPEAHPSK